MKKGIVDVLKFQECGCDEVGAESDGCDLITGQCECKRGVTGLKCDQCAPNHWGLSENGCKGIDLLNKAFRML